MESKMKVAIVCGSPSSEFLAPYDDKSWEIWVLGNRVDRHLDKRVTRIFEIHDNLTEHGDIKAYKNKLLELGITYDVIVGEKFAEHDNPLVEIYPYKDVEDLFGSLYLTSSPAYMLAYAILKGAKEIALYGVDLSISDHEYFWQRPCVEAWIGFAKGMGIKVTIPDVSHVGKSSYVEGRHWNEETEVGVFTEEGFKAMAAQHAASVAKLQDQRKELAIAAAAHDGAQQVYNNLARIARAVEARVDVKSLMEATLVK